MTVILDRAQVELLYSTLAEWLGADEHLEAGRGRATGRGRGARAGGFGPGYC
ncbi:hypothetical protein [Streptomyces sp. NPDC001770]